MRTERTNIPEYSITISPAAILRVQNNPRPWIGDLEKHFRQNNHTVSKDSTVVNFGKIFFEKDVSVCEGWGRGAWRRWRGRGWNEGRGVAIERNLTNQTSIKFTIQFESWQYSCIGFHAGSECKITSSHRANSPVHCYSIFVEGTLFKVPVPHSHRKIKARGTSASWRKKISLTGVRANSEGRTKREGKDTNVKRDTPAIWKGTCQESCWTVTSQKWCSYIFCFFRSVQVYRYVFNSRGYWWVKDSE